MPPRVLLNIASSLQKNEIVAKKQLSSANVKRKMSQDESSDVENMVDDVIIYR